MDARVGASLLGSQLRTQRQRLGLTQMDLATALGTSRQYVWSVETGRQTVGPTQAARIARAVQAPEREFIELALQDMLRAAGMSLSVRVHGETVFEQAPAEAVDLTSSRELSRR